MNRGNKRLLLGAGVVVALAVGFLVEERVRGVVTLRHWQAAMRAKGEKLTLAEILPPAPANPACLTLSSEGLASRWAALSFSFDSPPSMRYVAPGKAQAMWQADSWKLDRQRTNSWERLASAIEPVMPALECLRVDLTNQALVVRPAYTQGFEVMLPHLARHKGAAVTLRCATQLALRQRRLDLATENLVAMAALTRFSEGEGLLINELVRDAIGAMSMGVLWEAQQADGWSEAQLAAIQAAWEKPEFVRSMARAIELERVTGSLVYDRDRYSLRQIFEMMGDAGMSLWQGPPNPASSGQMSWAGDVLRLLVGLGARSRYLIGLGIWRVSWMEQDQLCHQQFLQQTIERLRQAAREKRFRPESLTLQQRTLLPEDLPSGWTRMRRFLSLTLVPAIDRSPDKAVIAEVQRDLAVTVLAIKRYQLQHGRIPDRLDTLVPQFLAVVPRDWFADAPLRYQAKPDGSFLLYSVGPSGEDHQGDASPTVTNAVPLFANGRNLVWPQPATAEEIAAYKPASW